MENEITHNNQLGESITIFKIASEIVVDFDELNVGPFGSVSGNKLILCRCIVGKSVYYSELSWIDFSAALQNFFFYSPQFICICVTCVYMWIWGVQNHNIKFVKIWGKFLNFGAAKKGWTVSVSSSFFFFSIIYLIFLSPQMMRS